MSRRSHDEVAQTLFEDQRQEVTPRVIVKVLGEQSIYEVAMRIAVVVGLLGVVVPKSDAGQ